MDQTRKRYVLSCWVLMILFFSETYVQFGELEVSVSMIIILMGSFVCIVESSFSMMQLFRAFTMMVFYSSLLIWKKMAPIWFFMPPSLLISFLLGMVALIIGRLNEETFSFSILGIVLGQIVFDLLIAEYQLHHTVGMNDFFIQISLTILLLMTIRNIFNFYTHVTTYIYKKIS